MNKIKTFILGGAAAVVAATGAQAADPIMDMKAPREPVYRCDITGFIELPGTDICFKVGGFARFVATANSKDWAGGSASEITPEYYTVPVGTGETAPEGVPFVVDGGTWGSIDDGFSMVGQGRLNFDARTQTEYGTLRGFIEFQGTNAGAPGYRHAYLQFGNWTMGHTWTSFQTVGVANYGAAYTTIGDDTFRLPQIRYTQAFGNGFALTLAAEMPVAGDVDDLYNADLVLPDVDGELYVLEDRRELPAFVAAIDASGGWGEAHLAGVVLRNEARQWYSTDGTDPDVVADPSGADSEIGWGVNFGLLLNAPTGEGDNFTFSASYTDGASQYTSSGPAGGLNVIWGNVSDDYLANGIIDSVEQFTMGAGFQHYWTPTVNTTIGGGYASADFGFDGPGSEVDVWDVFGNVQWNPVPRMSFLLEGRYGQIDWNGSDENPIAPGIQDDSDGFSVSFQAVRSF